MIELRFASALAPPPERIWPLIASMHGVNDELGPWLSMSHPPHLDSLDSARPGEVLFVSRIRVLGWLPVDRHRLRFDALYPGEGFDERSESDLQRVWIHRRRLSAQGTGSRLVDELAFELRLPGIAPFATALVKQVFQHRHRRLRRRHGVLAS